jgi:hypothetical protein
MRFAAVVLVSLVLACVTSQLSATSTRPCRRASAATSPSLLNAVAAAGLPANPKDVGGGIGRNGEAGALGRGRETAVDGGQEDLRVAEEVQGLRASEDLWGLTLGAGSVEGAGEQVGEADAGPGAGRVAGVRDLVAGEYADSGRVGTARRLLGC